MNQTITHRLAVTSGASEWMQDRLKEARAILVDAPLHADSLVILAARVVAGQTDSARECADAIDLLCQLDRRPLHAMAATAFPNSGAT